MFNLIVNLIFYKDISLFIHDEADYNTFEDIWVKENDFYDEIRLNSDDWIADIHCIDMYYNKNNNKRSLCYRMEYKPKDYTITNPSEFNTLVNTKQNSIVAHLKTLDWIVIRG